MPHTNRKKKPNAGSIPASETKKPMVIHTKRKEIQDEEGWTHIIDKPSRPTATTKNGNGVDGGDFKIGEVWYVNRTLEELQKEVEYWGKGWGESPASKELKELLEKEEKGKKAEDIVVLGLGSLQLARREGRRASATQLAALQTMIDLLFPAEVKAKVVCQDPGFSALDKEFLTGLGYEVVDDPEAFGKIGEGSLVYALHCYKEVYVKALSGVKPAIFVGTELGMFESLDSPKVGEETITKVEDTLSDYKILAFPQLRFDFSDTKIYWRPNAVAPATSDSTIDPPDLSLPDPELQPVTTTDAIPDPEQQSAITTIPDLELPPVITTDTKPDPELQPVSITNTIPDPELQPAITTDTIPDSELQSAITADTTSTSEPVIANEVIST